MTHRTVCLTGATGQVGSHILSSLVSSHLGQSSQFGVMTVVCPIRADCSTHAARRLAALPLLQPFQTMISTHGGSEEVESPPFRIVPLPCDLASPDAEAKLLSAGAPTGGFDCTIHCAAADGYLQSLDELRRANVDATRHVLNVHNASNRPAPHFLHMSTCATRLITTEGTEDSQSDADAGVTKQEGKPLRGFDTHYARTKHAAERVVTESLRPGTRGSICEIGYLFEDGDDQGWNDSNVVEMIWKVCCRIGCAVQLGEGRCIDMTHAGDLADSVVQL